jgi:hypothetical protein
MKINPVFYPEKLWWDFSDPLLGQVNPKPLPIELEDKSEEYKVQEVLAIKLV